MIGSTSPPPPRRPMQLRSLRIAALRVPPPASEPRRPTSKLIPLTITIRETNPHG